MKKLLTLIILSLIVSLIFVYATLFSYPPQKKENSNQNEFQKSDKNVEIISNTSKGLWGKDKQIKLVEDLLIGKEDGDESEVFGYIKDITLDGHDNLYVADSYTHTIKVYNNQGKFIKKFGRKGQGPGEFNTLDDIHWCGFDNFLYVVDRKNHRISQFSLDGTFIKGITMNEFKMRVEMITSFENGYFALAGRVIGRDKIDQKIIVVDHSFKNIISETLVDFPIHSVGMKVSPPISDIGVINGNQLYYTSPSDYEIILTDITLVKKKIIRKLTPKMFPPQYVPGFYAGFNSITFSKKLFDMYIVNIAATTANNIPLFDKKRDFIDFVDKLTYIQQLDLYSSDFKFLLSIPLSSNRYFADLDSQNRLYFIENEPFPKIIRANLLINY